MRRIEIDLTGDEDDGEPLARPQRAAPHRASTGYSRLENPLKPPLRYDRGHILGPALVSGPSNGHLKHKLDQDDHALIRKRTRLQPVSAVASASPGPPRENIIIVLDSDDEEIQLVHSNQEDECDSEDDYRRKHAAYNESGAENWNGMWVSHREPVLDISDSLPKVMAMLAVSCAEEGSASKVKQDLYKGLDTLRTERSRTKACAAAPHTMHTKLQDAGHLHGLMPATSESRFKHSSLESGVRRRGLTRRHLSLPGMFGVSCLHSVISLRRADGPINTIVQSGNILAAASSLATARNSPIEVVEQEACGFTLQLLLRDEIYASRDHKERMMRHDQLGAVGKPYSVESIAIDPNKPGRVVTAGNDGFVTVRDIDDVIGASSIFRSSPPEAPGQYPRGLQFRSSDSALAIPHSDGSIHIYKLDGSRADEIEHRMQAKLSIIGGDLHPVVRMVWGPSDMLYAVYEGGNAGHCVAFDIQRPNLPCKFQDIHETGEAVTINPSGQSIVVFTRDQDAIHKLRIYDVARRNVKHSLSLDLLPFATTQNDRCMDKITAASYSPDERLIAVGRSDDQLHLYDRRNMGKGPILQFKHRENPACRAAQSNGGIARLEWIQAWDGRGLGLVSGGGDGCVRVWDALGSSNDPLNGHTIAQLDSAVSDFSLGEQFKDEKPLAVGTESGGVYVYDRKR